MVKKHFFINPELCTGCRICEMACSFHRSKEFGPYKSAIWILKDEVEGIDLPIVCRHCKNPPCQRACPAAKVFEGDPGFEEPIVRDEGLGAVLFASDRYCIGCLECVRACPFGAMRVDSDGAGLVKCDLCAGNPGCVESCPTGALRFREVSNALIDKAKEVNKRLFKSS